MDQWLGPVAGQQGLTAAATADLPASAVFERHRREYFPDCPPFSHRDRLPAVKSVTADGNCNSRATVLAVTAQEEGWAALRLRCLLHFLPNSAAYYRARFGNAGLAGCTDFDADTFAALATPQSWVNLQASAVAATVLQCPVLLYNPGYPAIEHRDFDSCYCPPLFVREAYHGKLPILQFWAHASDGPWAAVNANPWNPNHYEAGFLASPEQYTALMEPDHPLYLPSIYQSRDPSIDWSDRAQPGLANLPPAWRGEAEAALQRLQHILRQHSLAVRPSSRKRKPDGPRRAPKRAGSFWPEERRRARPPKRATPSGGAQRTQQQTARAATTGSALAGSQPSPASTKRKGVAGTATQAEQRPVQPGQAGTKRSHAEALGRRAATRCDKKRLAVAAAPAGQRQLDIRPFLTAAASVMLAQVEGGAGPAHRCSPQELRERRLLGGSHSPQKAHRASRGTRVDAGGRCQCRSDRTQPDSRGPPTSGTSSQTATRLPTEGAQLAASGDMIFLIYNIAKGGESAIQDLLDITEQRRPDCMVISEPGFRERDWRKNAFVRVLSKHYALTFSVLPGGGPTRSMYRRRKRADPSWRPASSIDRLKAGVIVGVRKDHTVGHTLLRLPSPPQLQGYACHIRLHPPQGRPLEVLGMYAPNGPEDEGLREALHQYAEGAEARCVQEGVTFTVQGDVNATAVDSDRSTGTCNAMDRRYRELLAAAQLAPAGGLSDHPSAPGRHVPPSWRGRCGEQD